MHHLETIHSTKNITLFFHLLSFICVENFRQKLQNVKYVMTNALILHYEKKKNQQVHMKYGNLLQYGKF